MKTDSRKTLFSILLIAGAALAVYGSILGHSFVYDDLLVVGENSAIRQMRDLPALFGADYFRRFGEYSYRPVTTLTYFFDYRLWRLKPAGYHLTNLILHALNGVLVYLFLMRILGKRRTALLASLFFVVHPVNSEAVNAVGYREDLAALFFCLLSFLFYLRIAFPGGPGRRRPEILCLFFFFLALFAKETALVLPLLFLLYEVVLVRPGQSSARFASRRGTPVFYAGMLFVLGFYCVVRFVLLPGLTDSSFQPPSFYPRMLRTVRVIWYYFQLLIFPRRLSAEYLFPVPDSFPEPGVIAGAVLLPALAAVMMLSRRRLPGVSFGIGWFLLALLPVADIVPLLNPVAERYLYFPSVGFLLSAAVLLEWLYERQRYGARPFVTILAVLLLVAYSGRTVTRNRDWKDPLVFCRATVAGCPESARFQNNLGYVCKTLGKYEEALAALQKAAALKPEDAEIQNNLGGVYRELGRSREAIAAFSKSIAAAPDYAPGYFNLGNVYFELGKNEEAIAQFRKAIALNPEWTAEAYNSLGSALSAAGRKEEAAEAYRRAIALDPGYDAAYYNLGIVLDDLNKKEEAVSAYRKAIDLKPGYAEAHYNLAVDYYEQKKYDLAVRHCRRAIELGCRAHPDFLKVLEPYAEQGTSGNRSGQ